jgi:hypothetical protein
MRPLSLEKHRHWKRHFEAGAAAGNLAGGGGFRHIYWGALVGERNLEWGSCLTLALTNLVDTGAAKVEAVVTVA